MSSTTENLGLTLPDVTDFYDVGVTNTNMSLIDAAVGQIADTGAKETSVQSIITSIGTTTDTGGTATTGTVMAKLNALQSGVVSQEYIGVTTSGIPLISTPLTMTINGTGRFCGVAVSLYPNHSEGTLNKLVTRIVTDNTTIMTNRCYYSAVASGRSPAQIGVGTHEVYTYDFHSPNYDYALLLHNLRLYNRLGSANVFGEPTDIDLAGSYYSWTSRISILSNSVKFNQSFTVSISSEDYDNLSTCYIYLVYLLD